MKVSVLVFLLSKEGDDQFVYLGKRKGTNYAAGRYNAPGGKVKPKESLLAAAAREVKEEWGVKVVRSDLEKVAEMNYFEPKGDWIVHVFIAGRWQGKPKGSKELTVKLFPVDNLPLEKMWDNDRLWVPRVLRGERIKGKIWNDHADKVKKFKLSQVRSF